jgi:hypothetical protein
MSVRSTHDAADLVARLRADHPPHIARFGDGELLCCLEYYGVNYGGETRTQDLGLDLGDALAVFCRTPDLWLGEWCWPPLKYWQYEFADRLNPDQQWCSHNLFQHLDRNDKEWPQHRMEGWDVPDPSVTKSIWLAIRESPRRRIWLRPAFLAETDRIVLPAVTLDLPATAGHQYLSDVCSQVTSIVQPGDLVLMAFGMPGKPLQAHIMTAVPSCRVFDVGSALDPLCKASRSGQLSRAAMLALYSDVQ